MIILNFAYFNGHTNLQKNISLINLSCGPLQNVKDCPHNLFKLFKIRPQIEKQNVNFTAGNLKWLIYFKYQIIHSIFYQSVLSTAIRLIIKIS